jgi:hypothetical protein
MSARPHRIATFFTLSVLYRGDGTMLAVESRRTLLVAAMNSLFDRQRLARGPGAALNFRSFPVGSLIDMQNPLSTNNNSPITEAHESSLPGGQS